MDIPNSGISATFSKNKLHQGLNGNLELVSVEVLLLFYYSIILLSSKQFSWVLCFYMFHSSLHTISIKMTFQRFSDFSGGTEMWHWTKMG